MGGYCSTAACHGEGKCNVICIVTCDVCTWRIDPEKARQLTAADGKARVRYKRVISACLLTPDIQALNPGRSNGGADIQGRSVQVQLSYGKISLSNPPLIGYKRPQKFDFRIREERHVCCSLQYLCLADRARKGARMRGGRC